MDDFHPQVLKGFFVRWIADQRSDLQVIFVVLEEVN